MARKQKIKFTSKKGLHCNSHDVGLTLYCNALLISWVLLFLNANLAWADKVYLKGEAKPVEGTVLSVGTDEVLIKLPEGQQPPLIRTKVERVELSEPKTAQAHTNSPPLPEAPSKSKQADHDQSISQPILQPFPIIHLEADLVEADLEAETIETQPEETAQGNQFLMLAPTIPNKLPPFSTLSNEMFVSLSRFKGKTTQNQYAGLYNFPQRGTFWIRFPSPATEATPLQFTLFGKQQKDSAKSTEVTLTPGPEAFVLEVRFLNDQGDAIGKPEQVTYKPQAGQLLEWFHLLENMSGLCDPMVLAVTLPENTKVVEFRVINGEEGARHLVGYLGEIQLGQADISH